MSDRGQHTPTSADPVSADPAHVDPASTAVTPAAGAPVAAARADGDTGAPPAGGDLSDAGSADIAPPGPIASTDATRDDSTSTSALRSDVDSTTPVHGDAGSTASDQVHPRSTADHQLQAVSSTTQFDPESTGPARAAPDSPDVTNAAAGPAATGPAAIGPAGAGPAGAGPMDAGPTDGSPVVASETDADRPEADSTDADQANADGSAAAGNNGDVPFEISASENGEDDTPFRLTAPEGDETTATAVPTNRIQTRTVVLAGLLAVALAGAGTLAWFGWQVNSQRQTTLSTPAKIGSLTLDDSEQATATADYLQTALSAEVAMTKAVGAVYTGDDDRSVLFFGGTTLLWSPESDLDTAIQLMSDDQGAVTGLKEVDAGDFGGTMKCGATKSVEGDLAVCGWADHGSLALAMFPSRSDAEAAPLMRELRSAIQTRN